MRRAAVVRPGREEPVGVVDQRQRLAARQHQGALDERFIEPQPSPTKGTFPADGHPSTVLSLLI